MATLNELAYNIKNMAYGGSTTTGEESISIRQIKFWIHYYRAQMIKEQANEGTGINQMFFQAIPFRNQNDTRYDFVHTDDSTPWKTYVDAQTDSNEEFIVFTQRTIDASGYPFDSLHREDNFGRDFDNFYVYEEKGDYGEITCKLPNLIHANGFGLKNVRIRKSYQSARQNKATIDIPVLDIRSYSGKKYNRFTNLSPAATINNTQNRDELIIGPLKSHIRQSQGGYIDAPLQYRVYGNGLYVNPTEKTGWTDDDQYPLPDFMISELNRRILSQEFNITKQTVDDRIDDNIDTAIVQPKAQRQVRNS
tara:strand:+ start:2074 stop:2994 length:921 start_codon:yes stop_codon:yes gene_type:complete